MKVAMSGATGFVGGHLTEAFRKKGWQVAPLLRDDFRDDVSSLQSKIEGSDVVISLAGAPVTSRWTKEHKKAMYESRIGTTGMIVAVLGKTGRKPDLFISTSAVGIYDTQGTYSEENARYADDFLGRLAQDWEREALKARALGIRTVVFRFGIVLGADGGALRKMLIPFRLGLGGVIGDGTQPFSWVHIEDLVGAYFAVIGEKSYEGIYNLTAPNPTTNRGLTEAIGRSLHRPRFMRVPAFVLKLQMGEGAEVLLKGQRVLPKRLLESGFKFRFTDIGDAIEDLVGRRERS